MQTVDGQAAQKPGADRSTAGEPVVRFAIPLLLQDGFSHMVNVASAENLPSSLRRQHGDVGRPPGLDASRVAK